MRNVEIFNGATGALVRVISVPSRAENEIRIKRATGEMPDGRISRPGAVYSALVRGPVSRQARIHNHLYCHSRNEDKADSGRTLSGKKRVAHRRLRRRVNAQLTAITDGRISEDNFEHVILPHGCD